MLEGKIEMLADMILEYAKDAKADKDIIVYGLNSAITHVASILITIMLGIVFGLLCESVVFFISYSLIRVYAGGYHCKKATHCYIMSTVIMAVVLISVRITPISYMVPISVITLVVSVPIVLKLSPFETQNKPLDEVEKKHYRKKTVFHLSIQCFIVSVVFSLQLYTLGFVICIGIVIITLLLVLQHQISTNL